MRFHADGPSIPDVLLERCDAGRVVFLCGAGVSLPSGMPTFVELTQHVVEFFDPPADSEIMAAFQPWLKSQSAANVPLDQIFNLLHLEYGKDEVNALVTERLSALPQVGSFGREHAFIKRISSSQSGVPQVVTTNFDRLFEIGTESERLTRHVPPAFPDLDFGSTIEGVTYLHGRLVELASDSHPYVLSSADFGRAYLSEGWATSFIRNLLERYTVVLVGYQAEDPPVKYLLQGLNHDGQYDRSRLYAFDRGLPEDIEAKWRDRGVTAIAYPSHLALWKSMEAWAERADDPRKWRASVISKSQQDPKTLAPHERGKVAHVLRTVQGARLFLEADPIPHPEWVCVMDANVRSAEQSRSYDENAEVFDPVEVYGLDDDLRNISDDDRRHGVRNDSLLVWRAEDDNPSEFHRLAGRQPEGFESAPKRLGHLINWIGKSIDSPVLAWWAIRQNGLHPRLLQEIERQLELGKGVHERARRTWRLILEHHRDSRNRQLNGGWFSLKERIASEGWSAYVLREFRRAALPKVDIRPSSGLEKSKPPSSAWEDVRFDELGQFDIKFFDWREEDLEVPDEALPAVFGILQEQLIIASGLWTDIGPVYIETPTCYPDRDTVGREHVTEDAEVVTWFIQLFDRIADLWPELARAHAMSWPTKAPFFFQKLKLYAFNKAKVFEADYVADALLSFDLEAFWDRELVRELLFLLEDRWPEFSQKSQYQLIDRILSGPNQLPYCADDEFQVWRDELASRYARYLELHGCELTVDRSARLAEMIRGIPEWSDHWAASVATKWGLQGGWVGTDETPDGLMDLPLNQIIPAAKEESKHEFGSNTEKRPFTGLVKTNPRKALSALTIAARAKDYPGAFWSSMISELPIDVRPRLRRVFLNRIALLPHEVIVELRYTLAHWLEQNLVTALEFDCDLGWAVYDHIVDGIFSGGANATKSGLTEIPREGQSVKKSRRTRAHATHSPVGVCTDALFRTLPNDKQGASSLIPGYIKSRVERLFFAPGEGADHAVSISIGRLNWLIFVDPNWAQERLVPMLHLGHPNAEPAWNSLLHERALSPQLAEVIKPSLLSIFPWIESLSWDRSRSGIAAEWLGCLRVFHPDELGGLSRSEMRSALRMMSDNARNRFIFWLGQVGRHNEDGWAKHVIPLINDDWPRERRYRTSASVKAWISLLDDTGGSFPAVYEAVKNLLVPLDTSDHLFYRFTHEIGGEKPIAEVFPVAALDLMSRVTPFVLTRPIYELPMMLAVIVEAKPSLVEDPRYIRLFDLHEQS